MKFRLALVAVTLVAASALAAAQQRAVFRTEANYVEVDAVVTDKQGHFVTGLSTADFDVREGGKVQRLEIADLVDLGTRARRSTAPAPSARIAPEMNVDAASVNGRIYLLFFNVSTPMSLLEVGREAHEFIQDFMEPGDLVALWNTDAPSGTLTFTSDRDALLKALPPLGHVDASTQAPHDQTGQLREAIDWLGGIQGRRKSLILFTPGWPTLPMRTANGHVSDVSWLTMPGRGLADPANGPFWTSPSEITGRADVQIYTVDSRGLVAPALHGNTSAMNGVTDAGGAARLFSGSLDDASVSVDALRSIADETGGLSVVNTNDYRKGFSQIVEDNTRYYVLGYSSPVKNRKHVFIPISVKVLKPGLEVRARKGYIAR